MAKHQTRSVHTPSMLEGEKSMSLAGAYSEGAFDLVKWAAVVIGLGVVHHIIHHIGSGVTAKIFGKKE